MLTTVLPLVMLCVSLWAWAQKSTHAVTPENGRPSLLPSRQSCPCCSISTWQVTSSHHLHYNSTRLIYSFCLLSIVWSNWSVNLHLSLNVCVHIILNYEPEDIVCPLAVNTIHFSFDLTSWKFEQQCIFEQMMNSQTDFWQADNHDIFILTSTLNVIFSIFMW